MRRAVPETTATASPKLRLLGWPVLVLAWGFACLGGVVFWLLQGERDGRADEVERFALVTGRFGEHGHGGGGAGEADLVAGQGGEVGQEAAEAAGGAAGVG